MFILNLVVGSVLFIVLFILTPLWLPLLILYAACHMLADFGEDITRLFKKP